MTLNPQLSTTQRSAELRRRMSQLSYLNVSKSAQAEHEAQGWQVVREGQRKVRLSKGKDQIHLFTDSLWVCLVRLGISDISLASPAMIPGTGGEAAVDIIAADDEVLLVVKIFRFEPGVRTNLSKETAQLSEIRTATVRSLKQHFPGRKIQYVLATLNAALTKSASETLERSGLAHIDEDAVDYYTALADHLGDAAKYQLLGTVLAGTKIDNLQTVVAAIRGRMAGYNYYSFLIEPARLLKLGYILHRSKANSDLMPTYQRLVKKGRLRQVAAFVDAGGVFPNSLIVNVESGRKPLAFDRAGKQDGEALLGLLHLPQTYRSVYIIDGQHRLLGYANSSRANSDLIPVVAFENLPRDRQVQLFMEINENQQAVPKNLRNTLNADLLWDSDDLRERTRAIKLRIAQQLGEDRGSALFDRVLIGEASKTHKRCITIDSIKHGLDRSNLVGSFSKKAVDRRGTLYRDTSDETYDTATEFLLLSFNVLRDELPSQWELGSLEGGFVFINIGIEAIIRLLSDIVDHYSEQDDLIARSDSGEVVFEKCLPLLSKLCELLAGLTDDEGAQLRRKYGSGGPIAYWRSLQAGLRDLEPAFDPPGLNDYLRDQERHYNDLASGLIRDIESYMKADIRRRLTESFGARWQKDGVPHGVFSDASLLAIDKNRDRDSDDEVSWWDCLHLIDYQKILAKSQDSWTKLFEASYSPPDLRGKGNISRADKTSWVTELNKIRNQSAHEYVVTVEEYEFLVELAGWLIQTD